MAKDNNSLIWWIGAGAVAYFAWKQGWLSKIGGQPGPAADPCDKALCQQAWIAEAVSNGARLAMPMLPAGCEGKPTPSPSVCEGYGYHMKVAYAF